MYVCMFVCMYVLKYETLTWLAKFLVGFNLNKELSSVSQEFAIKLYSTKGKKTNKGNLQHRYHHFNLYFPLLHGLDSFFRVQLFLFLARLSLAFLLVTV